jgi:hypothetical protein
LIDLAHFIWGQVGAGRNFKEILFGEIMSLYLQNSSPLEFLALTQN